MILTVDTGYLDQMQAIPGSSDNAVLWASRMLLEKGVTAKPVIRLRDDDAILEEVAVAAELHGHGACLRLGTIDQDPNVSEAESMWPHVSNVAALSSHEVDLLIDLRIVQNLRDVQRAARVATEMLGWASSNGPWLSITIASGAFPQTISDLPYGEPTAIHRWDADFYETVVKANPLLAPDYGDYGIWHPSLPPNVPRGPRPNLRYVMQRDWQVYRENSPPYGNEAMHTLCNRIVNSDYWPATGSDYSSGDYEIARCAERTRGAGRATEWLRWGASHHITHIVDRLTNLGAP